MCGPIVRQRCNQYKGHNLSLEIEEVLEKTILIEQPVPNGIIVGDKLQLAKQKT